MSTVAAAVALLLTILDLTFVSSAGAAELSLTGAMNGEHDPSHHKGILVKKSLWQQQYT